MNSLHDLNKIANADFDGIIEGNSIFFYGKCHKCAKELKK